MINNKKAVSTVVATVIIIALTVTIGAVVWAVVSDLVQGQLSQQEKCFGVLDQMKLNNDFTCYNSTADKMQVSVSVGEINITGLLISISYAGTSKSVTLTNTTQDIEGVTNYPGGSTGVKMPGINAGLTYSFDGITSVPVSVGIIPIVKGQQCGSADTLSSIDDCQSLIS